jgi:hypothetical protein
MTSIRTFSRLAQGEKRLFQALTDRTVRLVKNEGLVLVEKILPQSVKDMQEMSQESNAIENRDFDTTGFVILGAGVFPNVVCHRLACYEDVVLNVPSLSGDFLERAVDVTALHRLVLHLITRYHLVIAEDRNSNVPDRTGLFVGGIVRGEIEHAFAEPRFRGFVRGSDYQYQQTA